MDATEKGFATKIEKTDTKVNPQIEEYEEMRRVRGEVEALRTQKGRSCGSSVRSMSSGR